MIRPLPILLTLAACTAPIEIPPPPLAGDAPIVYEEGETGSALAAAYPGECRIVVAEQWATAPDSVRVYALAHERCHCCGWIDEDQADCCAVRWMREAGYMPATWEVEILAWLVEHGGARRAAAMLECEQ